MIEKVKEKPEFISEWIDAGSKPNIPFFIIRDGIVTDGNHKIVAMELGILLRLAVEHEGATLVPFEEVQSLGNPRVNPFVGIFEIDINGYDYMAMIQDQGEFLKLRMMAMAMVKNK